ncbi:hypothetical protein AB0K51_22970 [Kitasatospora sp. NPDC049285]|uniref:hypothetical protein n=1 Tax=Kitasatospora sp. NPDC049285 TaxID=3157096 RepID=UPI00342CE684
MSVRTRSRRARLATLAAVAVLGATLPVLGGASTAWACGDEPETPTVSQAVTGAVKDANAVKAADQTTPKFPKSDFLPEMPKSVTAGGAGVEFGIELGNSTGAPIEDAKPFLAFYNEHEDGTGASILQPSDLTLEVMQGGTWKSLPLEPGCDPVLRADYSSLATHLDDGHATRFLFRLTVTGHSNAAQTQVDIYLGAQVDLHYVLPIVHPAAPAPTTPAPAPTTPATKQPTTPASTPTTKAPATAPTTAAAVPAAAVSSAAPTPTAVGTPAVAQNLASTGGGSSSTPLLITGTVLVALGAGVVTVAARRRAAAARD